MLSRNNIPNYLKLDDNLVLIIGENWKSPRGKGRSKQLYYVLTNGVEKHSSKFKKLTQSDIREIKLNLILNGSNIS